MARFTAVFFAFVASTNLLLEVVGQAHCSTSGIRGGISGCECVFLGACDARGVQKAGLNIADHLPSGLELFGYALPARNLAYLCEDGSVGILYDCNSRIPLYAATVLYGIQLSGPDPGRRPKIAFRLSKRLLRNFQQSSKDYLKANKRRVCYRKRSRYTKEIVDKKWFEAKRLADKKRYSVCDGSDTFKVAMHRGHLIASQYGRGDQSKKRATFVYTNAVPQFGDFNSNPWKDCEVELVTWGQKYCAISGSANVQMFILVGTIPSTVSGPSETRYFGWNGFSDHQDTIYRVNVPTEMWTAACCTFEYTDDGGTRRTRTKSTAFWRENTPDITPCHKLDVNSLVRRLNQKIHKSNINLFPYSSECNKLTKFIKLSG